MDNRKDLWNEVGNKCLRRASELLDSETTPTVATAEVVKSLVETAISMDMLNLRWAIQNRSSAATRRAETAVVSSEADIKAAAAAIHGRLPDSIGGEFSCRCEKLLHTNDSNLRFWCFRNEVRQRRHQIVALYRILGVFVSF